MFAFLTQCTLFLLFVLSYKQSLPSQRRMAAVISSGLYCLCAILHAMTALVDPRSLVDDKDNEMQRLHVAGGDCDLDGVVVCTICNIAVHGGVAICSCCDYNAALYISYDLTACICCLLLAIGCWLLAVGCCLLSAGQRHCPLCEVCVRGWQCHCVWMGGCIGLDNRRTFFWFNVAWLAFVAQLLYLFLHR